MSKQNRDNLNPTPQAVAAMYIYSDDYAAQPLGSMDFWQALPSWKQGVCKDLVKDLTKATERHSTMTDTTKTLAESLAEEAELLRRRFVHHTRLKRPMTLEQATDLCRRMDGSVGEQGDGE